MAVEEYDPICPSRGFSLAPLGTSKWVPASLSKQYILLQQDDHFIIATFLTSFFISHRVFFTTNKLLNVSGAERPDLCLI
jgi:hypothetical protein